MCFHTHSVFPMYFSTVFFMLVYKISLFTDEKKGVWLVYDIKVRDLYKNQEVRKDWLKTMDGDKMCDTLDNSLI